MTKSEIINELAQRCGVTQAAARQFYEMLNETVMLGLRSEQMVKIKGLGTFKTVSVKARKSVSVNGGEEIEIPAHDKVTFTAEKEFAERVNEPLSHLEVVELDDSPAEVVNEEPADDYKMSSRMKKLGEEAEVLKGLLGEINGKTPAPSSLDAVVQPSVETTHASSPSDTIENQNSDNGEESYKTEHAPSLQDNDEESYKTEHAPSLQDDYEKESTGRKMTHGGMLGRVFLCVLLLLLVGFGVFYWVKFSDNDVAEEEERPVVVQEDKVEAEVQEDKVEPEVKEDKAEPEVEKEEQIEPEDGETALDALRKIKVDYSQIKGTETVREGSRLTMISLRAYGDKRFWIYIYLANRDQLSTPGEIRTGMIIKIPNLDSRLTDVSNPDCLTLAKELEKKYVK